MKEDRSSEETAVVATYSSRQDAEVARGILEDHGVSAFIVADDVHPPLQLTEGVRLLVMSRDSQRARDALAEAATSSGGASTLPEAERREPGTIRTAHGSSREIARPARLTAWAYTALFVIVVVVIAVLLMGASAAAALLHV